MTSLRFHIRFPENKIKEPIIYQIGHEFKVVTNVRRADVRETTGWMDLELTGETEEIERAIDGIGLTPDIYVPLTEEDLTAERDPQLEAALETILAILNNTSVPTSHPTPAETSIP